MIKTVRYIFLLSIVILLALPASGQYKPAGINPSGLELWLDGNQGVENLLNLPASGTDSIKQWYDQSGNGNHASTGLNYPVYSTGINGKPALRFDEAQLTGALLNSSDNMTFFMVTQRVANATGSGLFSVTDNIEDDDFGNENAILYQNQGDSVGPFRGMSRGLVEVTNGVPHIYMALIVNNGLTFTYASPEFNPDVNFPSGNFDITEFAIGRRWHGAGFADAYVGEILMFDRAISGAEQTILNNYLGAKWSISPGISDIFDESSTGFAQVGQLIGIGEESDGSVDSTESGCSGLFMVDEGFLKNGNYVMVDGDSAASPDLITTGQLPADFDKRSGRLWYVQKTINTATAGSVKLKFKFSELGLDIPEAGDCETYYLLHTVDGSTFTNTTFLGDFSDGEHAVFTVPESALTTGHYTLGRYLSSPDNVNQDLLLWLKADCSAEITPGINASDSDNIQFWLDYSGLSNDASQVNASEKPTFNVTGLNGLPVIQFDGINDKMIKNPVAAVDDKNDITVFVVHTPCCTSGTESVIGTRSTGGDWWLTSRVTDGQIEYGFHDATDHWSGVTHPAGEAVIQTLIVDSTGQSSLFLTGTEVINANPILGYTLNGPQDIVIGMGSISTESYHGDVSEVIVYDRALNCSERSAVEDYLGSKFSICILPEKDEYEEFRVSPTNVDIDGIFKNCTNLATATASNCFSNPLNGLSIDDIDFLQDIDDRIMMAHDGAEGINTTDLGDAIDGLAGAPNPARWARVWKMAVVDSGSVGGQVTLSFDFAAYGIGATPSGGDYRLLTHASPWKVHAAPAVISGNNVSFTVPAADLVGKHVTVGTRDVSASPFPVSFLNFRCVDENEFVRLHWVTAQESNNSHFEVQRSLSSNSWMPIGQVAGAGDTETLTEYSFLDPYPFTGINYYRLKQVDLSGLSSYSNVVSISRNVGMHVSIASGRQEGKVNIIVDYPGSSSGIQQDAQIEILNMVGQEVYNSGTLSLEGKHIHSIATTTWGEGVYIARVTIEEEVLQQKFVVTK